MALNSEYLIKMPVINKVVILAAIIAVIFLAYFGLVDNDLGKEYKASEQTLQDKRSDLTKYETVEKDKEKLDRELKEKERKLQKAKEKLPNETEMEKLFLTISDLGQDNGIKFKDFKPMTEEKKKNLYIEVPIQMDFQGSYLYVINFFKKVTDLQRIVNFSGVSIKSQKGGGNQITVNCTAKTYKFIGSK